MKLRHRDRYDGYDEDGEARYVHCRCGCYGCKHHCSAHWSWRLRLAWIVAPGYMERRRDRLIALDKARGLY